MAGVAPEPYLDSQQKQQQQQRHKPTKWTGVMTGLWEGSHQTVSFEMAGGPIDGEWKDTKTFEMSL